MLSEKEQELLLMKYNGFIYFMAKKYNNLEGYDFEDIVQLFRMTFLEAVQKHDDKQGKLTTFAGLMMKQAYIQEKRKQMAFKRGSLELVLDENYGDDDFYKSDNILDIIEPMYDENPTPETAERMQFLEQGILEELDKLNRGYITKDLLYHDLSVQEVAEKYDISESLVKLINKVNLMRLKNTFKEFIIVDEDNQQFDLDDFNEVYDKEFFNGK